MTDNETRQRNYYERTAEHYEEMHIRDDDEHGMSLAAFSGIAKLKRAASVLDVGAGTGRALSALAERLGSLRLVGIEPVQALREIGYKAGIPAEQLLEGDAMALPFKDGEFDFVIETGILHHVPNPTKAVNEMIRVSRVGVMISDSNNYGQGSTIARTAKAIIRSAGLWKVMVWLQTKGKISKYSEGDGVYYSYSAFDNYQQLKRHFKRVFVMNTSPSQALNHRFGASHVMLLALDKR